MRLTRIHRPQQMTKLQEIEFGAFFESSGNGALVKTAGMSPSRPFSSTHEDRA